MTVAKSLPHLLQKVRKLLIPKLFLSYSCILYKNRGVSRIKSLLGTYSLCGRIAYSENDVINICNSAIDWDKVNSIIITERNKGINQLKSIIE